ncbi:MAG TPA: methyltransferase domain-containing protein [Actinomycetales bacterium]|nr:methyltransferase domain-containing protein [Actinomycetales bacterium]
MTEIRDEVRRRYAELATSGSCCGPMTTSDQEAEVFGGTLYDGTEGAPAPALQASLGCGVPTAVADLHPGETVLDLGSGAGADVLISARRVAPGGRAIGLDMTPEMLDAARRNASEAGVDNVEFVEGYLEDIPLPDASVDVVISNCVINLAADKRVVLAEAARVLRPGGRFAVSDVVADTDMDDATHPVHACMSARVASSMSVSAITSETANRPPGRSTRAASASTTRLSAARLITQLEMTTSTLASGNGMSSR